MKYSFGSITQSLAKKLIITVGIIIIGGGSLSWYTLISNNRKNLMNSAVDSLASYSDIVKKSIRYSMLVFSREPIQHTIEGIGSNEGIRRIRIYDSRGRVHYSSNRGDVGNFAEMGSFACSGCHFPDGRSQDFLRPVERWTTSKDSAGEAVLRYVDPIYNEPSCYTAACHRHSPGQKVLGVLETDFSLTALDRTIRRQAVHATLFAIGLIGMSSLILYFVLRRFVLKPIAVISGSMKKVAAGDLGQTISLSSRDEMGMLAGSFNVMTKDLKSAKEKVDNWTQTLELEIAKKTEELKRSQNKLIQAEKLAAVGRLTSDVAHRIRNPLTSIGGFAHRLERIAEQGRERDYASIMAAEVARLEKILRDVLAFSREDGSRLECRHVEGLVRDVSGLYANACREQGVAVRLEVGENIPDVLMDANHARQCLSILIANALDAMSSGGVLTIEALSEPLNGVRYVCVRVSDTGVGIPEDRLALIFEPFFSTKVAGGTGLGLSIARKIMEEHGGFIKVESREGEGSVFALYFPTQDGSCESGMNCWEYMKCGRNRDSALKCPAFPHFGRICWVVAGTYCEGKVQGTFAQKCENCKKCEYYQFAKKEQ